MATPSKSWTDILNSKIDADSPVLEELMTWIRDNIEHVDERVGVPVDSGDRQASHRHKGLSVDGSDFIELTPQENLIAGGDGVTGFGKTGDAPAGDISFQNGIGSGGSPNTYTPRRIRRSDGSNWYGDKRDKVAIYETLIPPGNKIKSSGGKGRFTCSVFVKREAAASGVVGGTFRFGLHDGSAWVSGAYVDISFDNVTTEYKRFYFVSNQIARPSALNVRLEWTAQPSDWDTVSNGDIIGHLGGVMVVNGEGLSKWDISHIDGGGDTYLTSPTDDIIYWWDENITDSEQAVV
jgi:hypothetical protein